MDHRINREFGRTAYHNQLIFSTEQAKTAITTLGNGLVMALGIYLDDLSIEDARVAIEQLKVQLTDEFEYLLERQEMIAQRAEEA